MGITDVTGKFYVGMTRADAESKGLLDDRKKWFKSNEKGFDSIDYNKDGILQDTEILSSRIEHVENLRKHGRSETCIGWLNFAISGVAGHRGNKKGSLIMNSIALAFFLKSLYTSNKATKINNETKQYIDDNNLSIVA